MIAKMKQTALIIGLTSILGYVTIFLLNVINNNQPTPYIDEIFHVPQAQSYCKGQFFEWDPKITTLPGLYLVSFVLLKPLELLRYGDVCSVYNLRFLNVIGTILNFILSFRILQCLQDRPSQKIYVNLVSALNIAIFPPLYLFTFLYYTDVWSLTFVLLMYYHHLSSGQFSKFLAGLAAFVAVLLRQTNVIWVGFVLINAAWNSLPGNEKHKRNQNLKYTVDKIKELRLYLPFVSKKKKKNNSISKLITMILSKTYSYIIVCCLFLLFVIINGSIVVGDKTAHPAVFHPMQNLYFLSFAAFFGFPFFLTQAFYSRKHLPNVFLFAIATAVCAAISEINKLEHPYLLADNRHIAFYLWKRIFGQTLIRRIIIPLYCISFILLYRLLRRCNFVFIASLILCTVLNLTPQYLFELRYFVTPFIMCRLHFVPRKVAVFESIFYFIINGFIICLFLYRPFAWPSEPGVIQRFVW